MENPFSEGQPSFGPLRFTRAIFIVFVIGVLAAGGALYLYYFRANDQETRHLASAAESFDRSDFEHSIAAADAVLAADPRSVAAYLAKANTLAQQGSLTFREEEYAPQAIALAEQALMIDPRSDEAWRIIGYAYEILQDYPAAHIAYAKSIALNPRNALTLSQEAHAYDLEGDTAKAEAGYNAALAINPGLNQASMGIGRLLVARGDASSALPIFASIATNSANARVRAEAAYSAGALALAQDDLLAAREFMTLSSAADPTYPLAWVGTALVDFKQAVAPADMPLEERNTLVERSMRSLQKALALNPHQSVAYLQMGIELATVGDTKTAPKFLQEAVAIVPDDITLSATEKAAMLSRIEVALAALPAR